MVSVISSFLRRTRNIYLIVSESYFVSAASNKYRVRFCTVTMAKEIAIGDEAGTCVRESEENDLEIGEVSELKCDSFAQDVKTCSTDDKMTKNERKKMRKKLRKQAEKEKKRTAKSQRIVAHSADDMGATSFYFEDGLRKVQPYFFKYQTYCRGRWIGRTVLDVISSEFRYDVDDNYATRLAHGLVTVNGSPVAPDYCLRNNDYLSSTVHRHELPVTAQSVRIVHDDDDLVVIDKPSSIPCHPCGRFRHNSITMILDKEFGYKNLRGIHRLDRATSGILIFVKNYEKTTKLQAQIKNHELYKEYVCRVWGEFPDTSGGDAIVCEAKLLCVSPKIGLNRVSDDGKEAKTTFEKISYNGRSSVVKCLPRSGRTHQIRVHLQYLGFPIMNDRFYNCPDLWGSKNGKAGDYDGKTDEKLIEDATRIFKDENYIDPEDYKELVKKHSTGLTKVDEIQAEAGSDAVKTKLVNSETKIDAQPTKRLKLDSGVDITTEPETSPSDESKDSNRYDPTCKDCVMPPRDPLPKELVMFLHSRQYKGPEFDFSTPLPEWAREIWNDEDHWTL